MALGKRRDAAASAARKEAAALIKLAAGPDQSGDTLKARIARAAGNLGWEAARTRHIWHAEVRVEVHEMDQLRYYALEEAVRRVSSARKIPS